MGAVIDQQSPAEFTLTVNALLAKSNSQITQVTVASFAKARESMAVLQVKREMLRTAIEMRQDGESAIAQSKDPFGEGPFGFAKTDTGFELASKLLQKGEPVRLIVSGQ